MGRRLSELLTLAKMATPWAILHGRSHDCRWCLLKLLFNEDQRDYIPD